MAIWDAKFAISVAKLTIWAVKLAVWSAKLAILAAQNCSRRFVQVGKSATNASRIVGWARQSEKSRAKQGRVPFETACK